MYEKYLNLKEKNSVLTDFEGNLNQKELEKPVKRRPLW
jgi:hypothetical protein